MVDVQIVHMVTLRLRYKKLGSDYALDCLLGLVDRVSGYFDLSKSGHEGSAASQVTGVPASGFADHEVHTTA